MKKTLIILLLLILSSCAPEQAPQTGETRRYHITQTLTLANTGTQMPEKQNVWVALIKDWEPYQRVLSREISPGDYTLFNDENGNLFAEFDLSEHAPGEKIEIRIDYEVLVNEIIYVLADCTGNLPEENTGAELHIESNNPQIISLAEELVGDQQSVCEQVRVYYDYITDKLIYTYNQNAWGAQAATGRMGADCSEYSSLLIALSRSQGIPARYYEGLLYLSDNNSEVAETEHAWMDIYLPGAGYVTIDPVLGRSQQDRDEYFAHHTADHIIVTRGRNPSPLRGASYYSHLYWPGGSTTIKASSLEWGFILLD